MKVRILYPTGLAQTQYEDKAAGDVVDMDEDEAQAMAAVGHVELVAGKVERATKAPGEKRDVTKPKA